MAAPNKEWKIISVGGSIIIPQTGFDIKFLKKFRRFILDRVKNGERLILVVGGGDTERRYQQALQAVANFRNEESEWMGIHALKVNAHFVRLLFRKQAYAEIVANPTKRVRTNKSIMVAAGWKPGHSTDYDAVLLARTYGVKEVVNLSNIEYVYDKDPNKFLNAKKIKTMDWKTFRREIVGNKWLPGKHVPFDPVASQLAQKLRLTVSILKGTNLAELRKALDGEAFRGTVIRP